jgi:putative glutathione S-transferase
MGKLVNGKWVQADFADADGAYRRLPTTLHNWVTVDGAPGPSGTGGYKAEADRYHLYVSLACPWAHRTLIFRKLKKLEKLISVSVVEPLMLDEGWTFSEALPDHLAHRQYLRDVYTAAVPDFTGRVTVPVLFDKKTGTIVNNESAEIIRMFNSAFDKVGGDASLDFYPHALRHEIDALNAAVYDNVNNGVYKAGFATTQEKYDTAVTALFDMLDVLDERLAERRYLMGGHVTEADWRLFTTLVRFDAVYVTHFKCNLRRIADYPNLSGYLRELYQMPGIAETVDLDHIRRHYYGSHRHINPFGIIPIGPALDFHSPHGRSRLKAA